MKSLVKLYRRNERVALTLAIAAFILSVVTGAIVPLLALAIVCSPLILLVVGAYAIACDITTRGR